MHNFLPLQTGDAYFPTITDRWRIFSYHYRLIVTHIFLPLQTGDAYFPTITDWWWRIFSYHYRLMVTHIFLTSTYRSNYLPLVHLFHIIADKWVWRTFAVHFLHITYLFCTVTISDIHFPYLYRDVTNLFCAVTIFNDLFRTIIRMLRTFSVPICNFYSISVYCGMVNRKLYIYIFNYQSRRSKSRNLFIRTYKPLQTQYWF